MSRLRKSDLGAAAGVSPLDTAKSGRFERRIRLSFRTGGMAQSATVAAGAVLHPVFQFQDINALAQNAPEPATLATGEHGLVLSLATARRICRIRLAAPVDNDRITVYRFDGKVVSDDPVQNSYHSNQGATLSVTDAALVVRRKNGSEVTLSPTDIDRVILRYAVDTPQLALRLVGSDREVSFPAILDDEGVPQFPANSHLGDDFAAALEGLLSGLPAPLPDPLEIDLILSAGQPCQAQIVALDLTLMLSTDTLPEKTVMRFPGGVRQMQQVALTLPQKAQIVSGSVTVTVAGTSPEQRKGGAPVGTANLTLPTPTSLGVRVTDTTSIATHMTVTHASAISGAEISLVAPQGPTELFAILYADNYGLPGAALAQSASQTITHAQPQQVAFSFPPTAIPAGPAWLGITVQSGFALATLATDGQAAQVSGPEFTILVSNAKGESSGGLVAALHQVRSTQAPTTTDGALQITVSDQPLTGLSAHGQTTLDLGPVIDALNTTQPTLIRISSTSRALVTIAPPKITYTMPD